MKSKPDTKGEAAKVVRNMTVMRIRDHKTMDVFKRYNTFHDEDLKASARQYNNYLPLSHSSQGTNSSKSWINQQTRP